MGNVREIRRHLGGIRKIQQITRAMKMVAGVKFRRALSVLIECRPYAAKMQEMFASLAHRCDSELVHEVLKGRPSRKCLLVIISSDRGLCGSFNSNIFRRVKRFMQDSQDEKKFSLYLIGRKAVDAFKRQTVPVVERQPDVFASFSEATSRKMGLCMTQYFLSREFDEIIVFYNEFKSVLQQKVKKEKLLPIEEISMGEKMHTVKDYLFEPGPDELFQALLPQYVQSRIHLWLMESRASEEGARMSMMDLASKNADEMIDHLMLQYNKARQLGITRELADITTGAEAMI